MTPIARWTDLDWALWLLDGAVSRIIVFGMEPDSRAIALLSLHADRLLVLRRDWMLAGASPRPEESP